MSAFDDLGNRMKMYYETASRTKLLRRVPVAIRLDGRAFHTFTRGFDKPFDKVFMKSMQQTMRYLCENIQGCVFGYTQSDEITLILCDYQKPDTSAWFNYDVQKLCSNSASMITFAFNKYFNENIFEAIDTTSKKQMHLVANYSEASQNGAFFDSRCFNIPVEEVTNLILWRQLDASRNSIQMLGHANFSQSELHKKSCNQIQDMLMTQKGINWNNLPTECKRGVACKKVFSDWVIDEEMPILKGEDRKYVEECIKF